MAVDPLGDSQGVKEDRGQGVKMAVGLHGDTYGVNEDTGRCPGDKEEVGTGWAVEGVGFCS